MERPEKKGCLLSFSANRHSKYKKTSIVISKKLYESVKKVIIDTIIVINPFLDNPSRDASKV